MIYNILGYLFLPFLAIYRKIRASTKDMSDAQTLIFYLILLIIFFQIMEILGIRSFT